MLLRHLACKDERAAVKTLRGFGKACCIQRDAPQWSSVEWSITRFPIWAVVLNYRGSARGLRFTASLRNGAVFPGGRKRPTFLATVPRFAWCSAARPLSSAAANRPDFAESVLRRKNSSIDDPG